MTEIYVLFVAHVLIVSKCVPIILSLLYISYADFPIIQEPFAPVTQPFTYSFILVGKLP